jgi:trans-aconitate methyltransferase
MLPEWYASDNGFISPAEMDHAHQPIVKVALRALDNRIASVIDLGCGNGALLQKIEWGNPRVSLFGIDKEPDRINHARELLPLFGENFHQGDIFENSRIWSGDRRYSLAILSLARMLEAAPDRSAQLKARLTQQCDELVLYVYGRKWLESFESLDLVARAVGFNVTLFEENARVGLARR